jgi:hypothetical protein
LAGKLGESRMMSYPAWERLAALVEAKELGRHPLAGFDGESPMYSF